MRFEPSGAVEPANAPIDNEKQISLCHIRTVRSYVVFITFVSLSAFKQSIVKATESPNPSARQFAWQQREVETLVHFGINTFTGQEWGSGSENPILFNPTDFGPDQWVLAAKAFNAKSVTLVAKHHDGFCLWPSKYTDYTVRKSPWKNGKGDLVRELSDSCRKGGIGFGIYLSPGDRHEPSFGRDHQKYNDFFCNQLTELLSDYGEITQVFFDGAQPVRDRKQEYDWQRYYNLIRNLQPNAVISVRGPDVRWVGNEDGVARLSEWSVIPLTVPPEQYQWNDLVDNDLGSSEKIKFAKYLHWYPALADVSLREGWFWNPKSERSVKSPSELLRIYENSVGRNASLQLNITPDTTGRIPDRDFSSLQEFGNLVRSYFATNLCQSPNANVGRTTDHLGRLDEKIIFKEPTFVRYVVLHEDITQGQNIEAADVTLTNAKGTELAYHPTTVGWKRILKINAPDITQIHVVIQKTRAAPHLTVSCY